MLHAAIETPADLPHRQFYTLSKRYHPDLNPNDSTASSRFVRISEAYHVLASDEKRSRYDRDWHRSKGHSPHVPRGSFSSHSGPAGSRPASGLSRRRTQFRGPPPSFYRSGGYGGQSEKRSQYQYSGQSEPGTSSGSGESWETGGYSPGQGEPVHDPDVPHWNRAAHRRTHDGLQGRRQWVATAQAQAQREYDAIRESTSMVTNFFIIAGLVVIVGAVGSGFWGSTREGRKADRKAREGAG